MVTVHQVLLATALLRRLQQHHFSVTWLWLVAEAAEAGMAEAAEAEQAGYLQAM
jgi:hypothetical protein